MEEREEALLWRRTPSQDHPLEREGNPLGSRVQMSDKGQAEWPRKFLLPPPVPLGNSGEGWRSHCVRDLEHSGPPPLPGTFLRLPYLRKMAGETQAGLVDVGWS